MARYHDVFANNHYGYNLVTYHYGTRNNSSLHKNKGYQILMKKLGTVTKRLYNIEEASIYLGRTPNAIRQMIWDGKLDVVRDGKRILLDIRDMDAWIELSKEKYSF